MYFFRVHFPVLDFSVLEFIFQFNEILDFSVFIKLFSRVLNIFRFTQIDGFDEPDTLVFTTFKIFNSHEKILMKTDLAYVYRGALIDTKKHNLKGTL